MIAILLIVLPIFALILAGWVARRMNLLGPTAATELNNFVVYLALPALLFDIVVHAKWHDVWQPGFIAAFGGSALILFSGTVAAAMLIGRRTLADGAVMGLNTGYPNSAFIGFPLALTIFGPASQPLVLVATIITVSIVFALSFVAMEASLQTDRHVGRMLAKVGRAIATNPIVIAPAMGAGWHVTGLALPMPVESFLHLLRPVAAPTALVAVGLFIAGSQQTHRRHRGVIAVLTVAKLIGHPLLAWTIGTALGLGTMALHVAVLIAALPTGTGPFMLAKLYDRPAAETADVILVTTILSVATVTIYLWMIGAG